MKKESLKSKLILSTGVLAALFVLGLMVFSPNQNASAISVSDEIEHRMTEVAQQEELKDNMIEVIVAQAVDNESSQVEDGYVLSQDEKDQFFGKTESPSTSFDDESSSTLTPPEENQQPADLEEPVHQENDMETAEEQELQVENTEPDLLEEPPIVEQNPFELNITRTIEPTEESITAPTKRPTRQIIWFSTPEPTEEPTPVPTQEPTLAPTEQPTSEPTEEPTQEPTVAPDIFWSAGFETGDISEWTAHGDWLRQGDTATYQVQSQNVHSGDYAVKLSIDTASDSSQAAYLFYWDTLPEAAYYSAWYFVPSNIETEVWWNIMQWKSTYNGDSDYSRPVFVLDGAIFGQTAISLCHLPDKNVDKVCWKQTTVSIPRDQWFHIEVYYERSKTNGHVIVWQDGVKLFDIVGYPTVLSDGTLYYSVNHYTDGMSPDISSIYIDDVAISYDRLSQDNPE